MQNQFFIKRIECEIEYLDSLNREKTEEEENRMQQLKTILEKYDDNETDDNENDDNDTIKLEIEKYMYRKKWYLLNNIHKMHKIKEYINKLDIGEQMKKEIIDKAGEHVNNNLLRTKKYVTYDIETESITLMPCLSINTEQSTWTIKI